MYHAGEGERTLQRGSRLLSTSGIEGSSLDQDDRLPRLSQVAEHHAVDDDAQALPGNHKDAKIYGLDLGSMSLDM